MSFGEMFQNPLLAGIVLKALTVGVLVSLCASLLGVSLVLKRYSMIGDGLSHVGFGALALASVLNLAAFSLEVSIPIVILAAFFLLRLSETSKLRGDSAIAVISTGAIAVGSILYNYSGSRNTDICNSLFGSSSIITITDKDMVLSVIISAAVVLLFSLYFKKLFSVTFDESFARATGIRASWLNLLLAGLTAVTVVVGMRLMGAIMISGLVVFPALSSMRICKSYRGVVLCSALISVGCFIIGFFTACALSYQTGATVITINLIVFIITSAISKLTAGRRNSGRIIHNERA